MKRSIDGTVRQQQLQKGVFVRSDCYLSETAEIFWCNWDELQKQRTKVIQNHNQTIRIILKLRGSVDQQLTVNIECEEPDEIINLGLESAIIDSENLLWRFKQEQKLELKLKNRSEKINLVEVENEEINFLDQFLNENLAIICWKQDFVEEETKTLELTDCIIRSENGEVSYRADIKKLIIPSQVLYNMVKDLNQNFNHDNPLDLSEIFKEFHHQHVWMYLCCVYNKKFIPKQLIHIISLLKISVKLDNQRLIKKILEMEDLGKIVREEIVRDDAQHPLYFKTILDFAKQHDFEELVIFCTLESLIQAENKKNSYKMRRIIDAYK